MEDKKNLFFELSDDICRVIYKKSLTFPHNFQSSLGDQIRRASLSIVLNIVEGGARISDKEKRQFLNFAFSSLKETKYLLYFAKDFQLIEKIFFEEIIKKINRLAGLLYGYLKIKTKKEKK